MPTVNQKIVLSMLLLTALPLRAELEVENAWIRSAPPGVTMLAGYATLTNNGDQEITIVAAESDNFELVEMHETKEIEGVSSMQPIANFEIAGGETRQFKPLGAHFMLIKPHRSFPEGTTINIDLILENDVRVTAAFVVRKGSEN